MRIFQKKQLLEIIASLHILHKESRERLERREFQVVQTALSDCQEAAIQMGEAIEKIMGIGTEIVTCLEEYCEKIYQVSIQLERISAQKVYKSLESILVKTENLVKHTPARKEVVLLPYKASMWDSLESIYLAAKEDMNCDVYVIPIPYFDKNPDGSFRQMHYEGDQYPNNIPITDYEKFDFKEHYPDEIYIHNPYDNKNLVTSVHPFFYSENLKKFTDELVYIPYFILDEISPDDEVAVGKMKHFCTVPGVFNADKVIVQSENMRKIYINVLTEAIGKNSKKIWEKKILGLGSPKLDKVVSTKIEDLDIPDEWQKIIIKPDGSRKRIVLYNTSVSALLHYNEKMIEKIKRVFDIFKENKDRVVLLWRPHPLIKATIESMRPQLWTEYEKLLEQYRKEGWGIYDDTADLDRAIIFSDAYYGDGSSLVQLYQKTGKMIMIQNINFDNP